MQPRAPEASELDLPGGGRSLQINHCRQPDCANRGIPVCTVRSKTGPKGRTFISPMECSGKRCASVPSESLHVLIGGFPTRGMLRWNARIKEFASVSSTRGLIVRTRFRGGGCMSAKWRIDAGHATHWFPP